MKKLQRKTMTLLFMPVMLCASVFVSKAAEADSDTYTLTWVLNGSVLTEQVYSEGDTVSAPEAPQLNHFIFTGWNNAPETMPAEDVTVTGDYNFDGVPVTDLANVYECYVEVSDEIAVTMYLRVDEEGNFVFSRSTDFSSHEKGAGKVYRKSDAAEIASGIYAVDISWSPMAEMVEPMLDIDAETMTFRLYGAADPTADKGYGTVACADGVYTLTFESGETTTFTYENDVVTFTSKLWYGTASFNNEDADGNFVSYTAALEEELDGEYFFVYYVLDGESVAKGESLSVFEPTEGGTIQFLSPMWFGATEPKFVAEDKTVTYPEFIVSDEAIAADINAASIVSRSDTEEKNETVKGD